MVEKKLFCEIHNQYYQQVFNDGHFIVWECPFCKDKNRIVDDLKAEVIKSEVEVVL